jgi:hypothetical protein
MKDEGRTEIAHGFILHPSAFILYSSFILSLASRLLFDLLEQFIHALAFLFDCVPHEVNLGSARKIEGETQLLANVRSSVTQGAERQPVFLFISGNRDKNLRVPAVVRKANVSNSYHGKSRVFQFVSDNLGNLLTKNVCNSLWATHNQSAGAGSRRQVKSLLTAPAICLL